METITYLLIELMWKVSCLFFWRWMQAGMHFKIWREIDIQIQVAPHICEVLTELKNHRTPGWAGISTRLGKPFTFIITTNVFIMKVWMVSRLAYFALSCTNNHFLLYSYTACNKSYPKYQSSKDKIWILNRIRKDKKEVFRKISKTSPAQCYLRSESKYYLDFWENFNSQLRYSKANFFFQNPYHISLTFYQKENGKKEKGRQNVLYNHLLTKQNEGYH